MNHLIVFCENKDEIERLFAFVNANEDDYKFIRKYRRSMTFRDIRKNDGRVFSCSNDKAEFRMRLMFNTQNYVV